MGKIGLFDNIKVMRLTDKKIKSREEVQKAIEKRGWRKTVKEKKRIFKKFNPILLNILKQLSKALGGYSYFPFFIESKFPVYAKFLYPNLGSDYSIIGHWSICKSGTDEYIFFNLKEINGKLKIERMATLNNKDYLDKIIDTSQESILKAIKELKVEKW